MFDSFSSGLGDYQIFTSQFGVKVGGIIHQAGALKNAMVS